MRSNQKIAFRCSGYQQGFMVTASQACGDGLLREHLWKLRNAIKNYPDKDSLS